jgi:DNA-binding SARP family transcriptional activator/tetratricopeptide (TPR) repeat protein
VEFRVLGPVEAWSNGERLAPGGDMQRTLLALLALRANEVVSADRLVAALWPDGPPASARARLHDQVFALRRVLRRGGPTAADCLVTRAPGYILQADADRLDHLRFERLVRTGRQARVAGDPAAAVDHLRAALGLWRGPALGGVDGDGLAGEARRLEEARLAAAEDCVDAELDRGAADEVIPELTALVAEHPLRERLRGQLMLALYRVGRQAEALEVWHDARRRLRDDLGLDPGPELLALRDRVLRNDESLLPAHEAVDPLARRAGEGIARDPVGTATLAEPTVPAQLPADVSGFAGRAAELAALDALLPGDAPTAVVISAVSGTAGVGKTALAVHWAHRVRDRFPDGQLYVNLQGYAPDPPVRPIEALAGFLHGLGVPADRIPTDVVTAAGMYRTLLADKRVLVLLDNARTAEQVRALLPAGPGCSVLITSRVRLGGLVAREGAHLITLDGLAQEEAHALIALLVGRPRAQAEPEAVRELAGLCGYLPLALRIAAANLVGQRQWTIAGYAARISRTNPVAALRVDDDDHVAVRVAFDQSYAALAADARDMFRLLGLVRGADITAPAAAAMAGLPPAAAERALNRLAAAHLVQQHQPGRYACHDLLRWYAAVRAEEEDAEPVRRAAVDRLLDWYLTTVRAAARLLYPERRTPAPPDGTAVGFTDHRTALAFLDAERANVVAATRHAAEHGPWPVAWQLADAIHRYFWGSGHAVDWHATATAGMSAARAAGDLPAQTVAELNLGSLNWRLDQHDQAIRHFRAAYRLARRTDRRDLAADALGCLGAVYRKAGRPARAVRPLTQALELNRRAGREEPSNIGRLGSIYWELGRLTEAAESQARACTMFEAIGSRGGQAIGLANLGETHYLLGQPERAFELLDRALALYREVGNRGGEAETLCGLARIHSDADRHAKAFDLGYAALSLAREVGGRLATANVLSTLGALKLRAGRPAEAAESYRQGRHLARETGHAYSEAEALVGLAAALRRLDRLDLALDTVRQALAITTRAGYRVLECQAREQLADILLAVGQPGPAAAQARRARDIREATGFRGGCAGSFQPAIARTVANPAGRRD